MKKRIITAVLMAVFLFVGVGITANAEEYPEEYTPEYTDETEVYTPPPVQEWESFPIDLDLNPPPGTATVADESDNSHGTEFFTIMTEAGNTFYLIIDRRHGQENVFFLNAVTEQDLLALTDGQLTIQDPQAPQNPTPGQPVTPPEYGDAPDHCPDPETPPDTPIRGNTTHFIIIGVAVVAFGIGGWYIKIHKPKQARQSITEYEDEPSVDEGYDTWDDDDLEDEDA